MWRYSTRTWSILLPILILALILLAVTGCAGTTWSLDGSGSVCTGSDPENCTKEKVEEKESLDPVATRNA